MAYSYSTKIKNTANLFRKAVPKMSKLNIPLTPENYHTWYEYTHGGNKELNKTIDELLNKGTKFTSKVNRELYNRHIYQAPEEGMKSFQQEVKKLVAILLDKIKGMTNTTQEFSASLEKYNEILQQNPDIDSIATLITNLIDDVGTVLETNQSMGSLLESMNEEVDVLRKNMKMLNFKAYTDELTEIPNRRAFYRQIDELFDAYHDEGRIFSLLLVDIDEFKQFNDRYGHDIGDRVLKYVATVMTGGIKGDDKLARYGGEEFVIMLPNTDYDDAISVGNYLRKKISGSKLVDKYNNELIKEIGYVTVSIGVAVSAREDDIDSIVKRADNALYIAKENGRNQVIGERYL